MALFITMICFRVKKHMKPKAWYSEEWQRILRHMDEVLQLPKVLSHSDFHIKNMIYDEETGLQPLSLITVQQAKIKSQLKQTSLLCTTNCIWLFPPPIPTDMDVFQCGSTISATSGQI